MLDLLANPQIWVAFFTLTALELVLGIDNIVFISILADKLPASQRLKARRLGLFIAMFMRIALLFFLSLVVAFTSPLFSLLEQSFSGRDLILLAGGVFLLWKSTKEIHHLILGEKAIQTDKVAANFGSVILQIVIIDAVFSIDSIITAVGLVEQIEVMVAAIVVSVILMMLFAELIGNFVSTHPSIKMLALVFLFMIAMVLIADGLHHHIPKGYIYFAMAFALIIEALNIGQSSRKLQANALDNKVICSQCPNRILAETANRNRGLCTPCHKKLKLQPAKVEDIDDADLCYIDNFPEDLPYENGATHIGIYFAWIIKNGLIGERHRHSAAIEIQFVREELITGREFLIRFCDEKLCEVDLNSIGNEFTRDYYQSELFLQDYEATLGNNLETLYHVSDSWENYHKLAPIIDKQFEQWKYRKESWVPTWE